MLSNYGGLSSVGYYTFGVKFAVILKHIMDSIAKAWNPYFLEKAQLSFTVQEEEEAIEVEVEEIDDHEEDEIETSDDASEESSEK